MSLVRTVSFFDAAEDSGEPSRIVVTAAPEGNSYILSFESDGGALFQIDASTPEGRNVINQLRDLVYFAEIQGAEHHRQLRFSSSNPQSAT